MHEGYLIIYKQNNSIVCAFHIESIKYITAFEKENYFAIRISASDDEWNKYQLPSTRRLLQWDGKGDKIEIDDLCHSTQERKTR